MLIANGLAILVLLIFILGILVLTPRLRRGPLTAWRPLPAFRAATEAIGRAAEEGRTTHLSSGPSPQGIPSGVTADTLAGLQIMGRLARRCAEAGTPVLATTGGALAFPLAENVVAAGYAAAGRAGDLPAPGATTGPEGGPQGVRLLTHDFPLAYAAAAANLAEAERVSSTVQVGPWSREYLLVNEAQQRAGLPAVAGATDPEALAPMLLGADYTLIGEEIFAGGAYLDADPAHQASLLTQDIVRGLVLLLIVVGVVLASAGVSMPALLGLGR